MGADDASGPVIIHNDQVKAQFTKTEDAIEQQFFARQGDDWVLIAESFVPPADYPKAATQLYNAGADPANRFVVSQLVETLRLDRAADGTQSVTMTGTSEGAQVTQTVSLKPDADHFHVVVDAVLAKPQLDVLISPYTMNIEGKPDITHTPTHKRNKDCIIGDGVFYAPASLVQQGGKFFAIAPDLDIIEASKVFAKNARQHPRQNSFAIEIDPDTLTMPTGMDLELTSKLTDRPLIAYGMMDHLILPHVFWERDNRPGAMVRQLSDNRVGYGFEFFVRADAPPYRGYQRVSQYLWNRYGHPLMDKPKPQVMPLATYADVCYPAQFKYQGYSVMPKLELVHRREEGRTDLEQWQSWEEDGVKMGAFRLTAPQWYNMTYNQAWWNNMSDATGLYYWGKGTGNADWVDKAQRVVNHTLSAPQKDGMFPGLYHLKEKRWIASLWHPPLAGYAPHKKMHYWNWKPSGGAYMTASASTTAGFLVQYYNTCEQNDRIVPYVERYADFLIKQTRPNGIVPAWFDKDLNTLPSMREFNADGGVHAWVLAELYKITRKEKYRDAAVKIAAAVESQVLPQQRWSDFETFYSCAVKAETFFDKQTGQPGRNLMSMCWAIMGLTSTYEITGDQTHLDGAEAAADFFGLYHVCWDPYHIMGACTFGSVAAQLGDGEWLDQRDHRFAGPLVKLGLLSGRRDLVERGISVSRASLVLLTHERLIKNEVFTHGVFPEGIGGENLTHEGYPQTPLGSGPSWSSVGGLAAAAHVVEQLGGAYIDLKTGRHHGIDGVRVTNAELDGRTLRVSLRNTLGELDMPWEEAYTITLRVVGLPDEGDYSLIINDRSAQKVTAEELSAFRVEVSAP